MESIVICSALLFSKKLRSVLIWIHSGMDSLVIWTVEFVTSGYNRDTNQYIAEQYIDIANINIGF